MRFIAVHATQVDVELETIASGLQRLVQSSAVILWMQKQLFLRSASGSSTIGSVTTHGSNTARRSSVFIKLNQSYCNVHFETAGSFANNWVSQSHQNTGFEPL